MLTKIYARNEFTQHRNKPMRLRDVMSLTFSFYSIATHLNEGQKFFQVESTIRFYENCILLKFIKNISSCTFIPII